MHQPRPLGRVWSCRSLRVTRKTQDERTNGDLAECRKKTKRHKTETNKQAQNNRSPNQTFELKTTSKAYLAVML